MKKGLNEKRSKNNMSTIVIMNKYLLDCECEKITPKKYNVFLCKYCLKSYNSVVGYIIIKKLSHYFTCERCETTYPIKELIEKPIWLSWFYCGCI
jgi:hypothetical protein